MRRKTARPLAARGSSVTIRQKNMSSTPTLKSKSEALVFLVEYINQRSSDENWRVPQKNVAEDREAIITASALLGRPLEEARAPGPDPVSAALAAAAVHVLDCLVENRDEDDDVRALEEASAALQEANAAVVSALKDASKAMIAAERVGKNRADWIEGYESWVDDMGLGDDEEE
jgi:hypothetical protein